MKDQFTLFPGLEMSVGVAPSLEALVRDHYADLLLEEPPARLLSPDHEPNAGKRRDNARTYARRDCGRYAEALRRAQAAVVSRETLAACRNSLLELAGYRSEAVSNGGAAVEEDDWDAIHQRTHDLIVRLGVVLGQSQESEAPR